MQPGGHGNIDTLVVLIHADMEAIRIWLGPAMLQPEHFDLPVIPSEPLTSSSASAPADECTDPLLLHEGIAALCLAHCILEQMAAFLGDLLLSSPHLAPETSAILADELPDLDDEPLLLLPPHLSPLHTASLGPPSFLYDEYLALDELMCPLASVMLLAGGHGDVDTFAMWVFADDVVVNMWRDQPEANCSKDQ